MNKIIKKFKLKQQFVLISVVTIVIMGILQIFDFYWFYNQKQKNENIYATNLLNQEEQKLEILEQEIKNIALTVSYNDSALKYLSSTDILELLKLDDSISRMMLDVESSNENIRSIILINNNGRTIGPSNESDFSIIDNLNDIYHFEDPSISLDDSGIFSGIVKSDNENIYCFAYILPIFSTDPNINLESQRVGTCIVLIDTSKIVSTIKSISANDGQEILILDKNNKVIAGNSNLKQGIRFNSATVHNHGILYQNKYLRDMNWRIMSIIPKKDLIDSLAFVKSIGILFGAIAMIFIILLSSIFIKSVTLPIEKIVTFMKSIDENNMNERLEIRDANEVGTIAKDINKMLDKIDLINTNFLQAQAQLYELELSEKQAEISRLESQINPHFLYNTLNCISSIGLAYDVKEVVIISTAMAKIFRYSIKGDRFVNILEEINIIKDYLQIVSIRFLDKFKISIEIDPKLYQCKMLKMILQPLIENAVYHGLEPKNGHGDLWLTGSISDDRIIHFEITDNGKGMAENELKAIQSFLWRDTHVTSSNALDKRSIGLINIDKRIKFIYGENYGLTLFSEVGHGTKVIVEFPIVDTDK